ncbi:MAG: hypothetical protein PHU23_15720 [Dehalococcoidales bacterium]|nr:hypothetical protein [Dehalococcoidales bacterium]
MDQKTKLIIIGLIGFSVVCLFLFLQATSSQQMLTRERNDLKTENATLISKVDRIEGELKASQEQINTLRSDKDNAAQQINELQGKLDLASRTRDELVEKLKAAEKQQVSAPQQEAAQQNTDAYWGQVLKSKTSLELQLSSMREELKKLQVSNDSLQREKNALQIDINSLRTERDDLTRQLGYNQKLLDSISQDVVREKNDKAAILETLKKVKGENRILSRQLSNLNSHKASLDKKVEELQEGKSTIERRLSEMETMLADRVSQINSLKDDLDAIRSGKPVDVEKKFKESVELPAIVVHSGSSGDKAGVADESGRGKLLAVNLDNNFVVIDTGVSSGIKSGDRFSVYREGKQIGSIEVIQVRDNISACDIKRMSTPFKIGDIIK